MGTALLYSFLIGLSACSQSNEVLRRTTISSHVPSPSPTPVDTTTPSYTPSASPTPVDTTTPSYTPSGSPTPVDTTSPSYMPSASPTPADTTMPSYTPSASPTPADTTTPSYTPSPSPTPVDTTTPSYTPSPSPTPLNTTTPSYTPLPSPLPTSHINVFSPKTIWASPTPLPSDSGVPELAELDGHWQSIAYVCGNDNIPMQLNDFNLKGGYGTATLIHESCKVQVSIKLIFLGLYEIQMVTYPRGPVDSACKKMTFGNPLRHDFSFGGDTFTLTTKESPFCKDGQMESITFKR
jgi:hypothetical protein